MRFSGLTGSVLTAVVAATVAALVVRVPTSPAARAAEPERAERAGQVAICDMISVVEAVMDSERYKPARDEMGSASEKAIAEFRDRAKAAEDALRAMDEKDPGLEAAQREYQVAGMAFQRKGQELAQEMDALTTRQLIEAYSVVRASADAVAEQLGFGYVIASRPSDKLIEAVDTAAVVRAMLARPVVRMPEGADITPDVRQDLKLD